LVNDKNITLDLAKDKAEIGNKGELSRKEFLKAFKTYGKNIIITFKKALTL